MRPAPSSLSERSRSRCPRASERTSRERRTRPVLASYMNPRRPDRILWPSPHPTTSSRERRYHSHDIHQQARTVLRKEDGQACRVTSLILASQSRSSRSRPDLPRRTDQFHPQYGRRRSRISVFPNFANERAVCGPPGPTAVPVSGHRERLELGARLTSIGAGAARHHGPHHTATHGSSPTPIAHPYGRHGRCRA
jgi:hypothetical protein